MTDTAHTIATELRVLLGQLRRRLREETNPGDFSFSQMSVLARLERDGPTTLSALARVEGVRSQSMGATIAVLDEAGLVCGAPDPDDGRQTILTLTDAAREKVKSMRAAREDWLFRAVRKSLLPQEEEELLRALDLLKRILAT